MIRQPWTHTFNDADNHDTDTSHCRRIRQNVMGEIIGAGILIFH